MSDAPRSGERVQKILARAGVASRRKAEVLIEEGRVEVNGKVCHLGDRMDASRDFVRLDGRIVHKPGRQRYLLLNKPRGYLSTVSDPEGRRTVLDLVPPGQRKALFPVGRLDFQTEGLLLLTTDGEFGHRIMHPRFGCTKTYSVKVRGVPSREIIKRLEGGIRLDGKRTAPCTISPLRPKGRRKPSQQNSWWSIELNEGRTRQIREMFKRVGHPVMRLRRTAIGSLTDGDLASGACRELSQSEVAALLATSTE